MSGQEGGVRTWGTGVPSALCLGVALLPDEPLDVYQRRRHILHLHAGRVRQQTQLLADLLLQRFQILHTPYTAHTAPYVYHN